MSIELQFGEHGPIAYPGNHFLQHLEKVRDAVINLLKLDDTLRDRRIVFRSRFETSSKQTHHEQSASHLIELFFGRWTASHARTADIDSPSGSHTDELIVNIPRVLQTPGIIERLMVEKLLYTGLGIPHARPIRFILDGVLGTLDATKLAKHKSAILNLPLVAFLATKGPEGETRSLQAFLSGHCKPEEQEIYRAVAASFVTFLLEKYGPRRLGIFASNLKPLAPDEASRAAFRKPFHALQLEWESWAHLVEGKPLSVPSFVVKAVQIYLQQRWQSFVIFTSTIPQLAYTLVMPVWLSHLFDQGILKGDATIIEHTLTWLFIGYTVSALSGITQDFYSTSAAARGIGKLRERMFLHTQKLADDVLQKTSSGEITSTFSSDLILIETVVTRVLPNLLFRVILLFGSVAIAFSMEWHMATAAIVCLPIAFILPRPLANIAAHSSYERKTEDASLAGLVQENVVLSRTIRMFHLQQDRLAAFRKVLDHLEKKSERANLFSFLAGRFTTIGASFVQLLVIAIGAVLAVHGALAPGIVIAFIGLLLNMGGAIGFLADSIPMLIQAVGAWQRVDMLFGLPISREDEAKCDTGNWNGVKESIEFKDVEFNYPGGDPVLDKISFKISMGQSIAFVGPSGSGKTTIVNLIQRHIDITSGSLLMDGTPIGAISGADLRRRMATVAQDNPLFNLSVKDNIRMGREDATDDEIIEAAKAAEIDEGIRHMAHGYDTMVGELGRDLSGGQRQRVAIARALLRNPSVLILDEATSALDPESQKAINATIGKLRKGRIIVAVTHHLQETVDVDQIIVLQQGRIVEKGTHTGLLKKQGLYASMWISETGVADAGEAQGAKIKPDWMRAIPFFKHLDDTKLAAIATMMQRETFDEGRILLREAKRPDRFCIIVQGTVIKSVIGRDGHPVPVKKMHKGDFFGEFALIEDLHQIDTITAATPCVLLTLTRPQFVSIFSNEPELRVKTEQAIAAMLQSKFDQLLGPNEKREEVLIAHPETV